MLITCTYKPHKCLILSWWGFMITEWEFHHLCAWLHGDIVLPLIQRASGSCTKKSGLKRSSTVNLVSLPGNLSSVRPTHMQTDKTIIVSKSKMEELESYRCLSLWICCCTWSEKYHRHCDKGTDHQYDQQSDCNSLPVPLRRTHATQILPEKRKTWVLYPTLLDNRQYRNWRHA